jgi:hypothetical protein
MRITCDRRSSRVSSFDLARVPSSVRIGIAAGCLVAALASLQGCIAVGGTTHRAADPTIGQQLIDLKRAKDEGALSPEEFERLRQDVVNGRRPA